MCAVMNAVGSPRAAFLGVSEGRPLSLLYAATYPERAHALVLCGAEVKERATDDWPWGEASDDGFERGQRTKNDFECGLLVVGRSYRSIKKS